MFYQLQTQAPVKNNLNIVLNPMLQLPCSPQEWSALEVECSVGTRRTRQNFTGEEIFQWTA